MLKALRREKASNNAIRGRAGLPPTITRRQWSAWITTSLVYGLACAALALILLWRSVLGWAPPTGSLALHVSYWVKMAFGTLFPSFMESDRAAYSSYWTSLHGWEWFRMMGRIGLASLAAFVPCLFMSRSFLTPRDLLIHLRGARRHEGTAAVKQLNTALKSHAARCPDHDLAPGVVYPSTLWTQHVLVVGGVGAGKSTMLRPLIDKIIRTNETLFLFDPKGEFTSGFLGPILIAPWDKRSWAWDIARDMRNSSDMSRFAAAMIKDSHDPLWSNAARQVLVGIMLHLRGTAGRSWGWKDLAGFIRVPQKRLLDVMREWHPVAVRAVEDANVTTTGILINLGAFCSPIFDLAAAWGDTPRERRISLTDWLEGKGKARQLIVQGHGAYSELTKGYVAAMVETVAGLVNSVEMGDSSQRKVWFVADEFAKMGRIPVLPLFEVGRSRGVRCVVACQDFAQLEELHGEKAVRAMIAMCGTLVIGRMMPGRTAKEICDILGEREVERPIASNPRGSKGSGGSSAATGESFQRENIALYKPAELSSRLGQTADQSGVKMIVFTGGQAYELVWPHFAMAIRRHAHVPAPWVTGADQSGRRATDTVLQRQAQLNRLFSVPKSVFAGQQKGDCDETR